MNRLAHIPNANPGFWAVRDIVPTGAGGEPHSF